jgi:tight adherence protein C
MPLYVVVAALIVTLSVPLLVFTLVGDRLWEGRVNRNLNKGLAAPRDLRTLVLSQSGSERILQPALQALASRARRISPAGLITHLERRIVLAGLNIPVDLILVAKLALCGLLGGTGFVAFLRWPSWRTVVVAVLGGFAGYLGPDVVLARRATRRQMSIRNELPDLLDQVTICVEAGLGFDAALARSSRPVRSPLTQEVTRMHQELRLGVPRREALENLLARTDVAELRQFTHALVQAETYGVPVSQMLRAQSAEQREKRRQAAEERAMKLPVKISFPLVFCILPAMFIVILGPAVINLLNSTF